MEKIYLVIDKSNPYEHNWSVNCFRNPEDALKFMKSSYSAPIESKNGEKIDAESFVKSFTKVGQTNIFYQTICGYDDDNTITSSTSIYEVTLAELK